MQIKLLQLNIEAGREMSAIIDFVQKQQFDILHFQEVSGQHLSKSGKDNFTTLCEELQLSGELEIAMKVRGDNDSYFGNATFFRSSYSVINKEVVWLQPYKEFEAYGKDVAFLKNLPRNALALQFLLNNTPVWFINTHLAWGPTPDDEPYKIEQGEKLYQFIETLQHPFVLTGDFNVTPDSKIIKRFEEVGINQTVKKGFLNTLNPTLHRVSSLFPAGLAVDYIFTEKHIVVKKVTLIESPDLSDHYGISLIVEI